VVGQLFRGNLELLSALRATRTHHVLIPKEPERADCGIWAKELRKFSTMGSACTFPVETIVFLAVALAATLTQRGLRVTYKNIRSLTGSVAVFGDDIIVPADSRELLVVALELLWFKVNAAKTYGSGWFRESCGVDAFRGEDVTPAYWLGSYDGKPGSYASTVESANNFYQKFMVETSKYLETTIRRTGLMSQSCRTDQVSVV